MIDSKLPARMHYKHGQFWHVATGKLRHWTALGADRRDADKAYAKLEKGCATPGTIHFLVEWHMDNHVKTLAEVTQVNYRCYANRLNAVIGHRTLKDFDSCDVAMYLDGHHSKLEANRDISLLSGAYRKALRLGWVKRNPCIGVERNPEKPRDKLITAKEFLIVREVMPVWIQCMMDISYLTSLRQGDILKLPDDCDATDLLRLTQGKTGTKQAFILNQALTEVVTRAREARPKKGQESAYLFTTRTGKPYARAGFGSRWHMRMRKLLAAGLIHNFHFHDIRAKSLTDADETEGLNPQLMAGHAHQTTTDRYIKNRKARPVRIHTATIK